MPSEEFVKGFETAKESCLAAVAAVKYQTGRQPDRYSEWVWSDRPAADVKQDCLDAVSGVEAPS